jgi:carbon-monoxide dehydrogenase medium subunit
MKPAPFEYLAPRNLEEALAIMHAQGAEAKLLAGGQSLIPVMNFRLAQPTLIVDLNNVTELGRLQRDEAGGLRIGAMVRQRELERSQLVADLSPLLHEAMPYVAHPQIRNRGTLGGSLAHADPAAELPVVAIALDVYLRLQRQGGERWIRADEFYTGLFSTALGPEEILAEVTIPPVPANTGYAFMELARRHGDYAQAGAAALVTLDEQGVCRNARLVFLAVGEVPMVAHQAAQVMIGQVPSVELIAEVARMAAESEIDPVTDIHATADYKRHLAQVLARRTLQQATDRATSQIKRSVNV